MKTLLFCTSYIPDRAAWDQRYSRWLEHHRHSRLAPHAIAIIDDGSPYLPDHLSVVPAAMLGHTPLPPESIVHFSQRLGRPSTMDFPGWWRSMFAALALAKHYGFERIIHVESDSFILSERLATYLSSRTTGWTALWLPHFACAESAIQVLCQDAFHLLESLMEKGPYGFRGEPAEATLGFTHIEQGFNGGRYNEFHQTIPVGVDYSVQTDETNLPRLEKIESNEDGPISPALLSLANPEHTASFEHAATDANVRRQLEQLAITHPFDAETSCRFGIALYLSGDFSGARKALERANWIRVDHALTCKFLAACRMQLEELAGAAFAATNGAKQQPDDDDLQNMAGAFLLKSGHLATAIKHFRAALLINPENSSVLSNLALIDWTVPAVSSEFPGGFQEMQELVRKALLEKLRMNRLTLDGAKTLLGFGVHYPTEFDLLLQLSKALAEVESADAQTLFTCGHAFTIAGDREAALRAYRRALDLKPDSFRIENAVGHTMIARGGTEFVEGFRISGTSQPKINPPAFIESPPRWRGNYRPGDKLLVYQEQGVGDALLCLRFLPLLRHKAIDAQLWLRPDLASLVLEQTGISLVRTSKRPEADSVGANHVSPMFGLVDALDIEVDALPDPFFITAPLASVERFRSMLPRSGRLLVGLGLLGNPDRPNDWTRSVAVSDIQPLTTLNGIDWVNLSVDHRPELEELKKALPEMVDLRKHLIDFDVTAALISNLDVVVAIDSVIAHLAAALGKKVLLLAPTIVDWRWKIGDTASPWWPSVEVFPSGQPGKFANAVQSVAERLQGLCKDRGYVPI